MGAGASLGAGQVADAVEQCALEIRSEVSRNGSATFLAVAACDNLVHVEETLHELASFGEIERLRQSAAYLAEIGFAAGEFSSQNAECLNVAAACLLAAGDPQCTLDAQDLVSSAYHVSKTLSGKLQIHYARALVNYWSLRTSQGLDQDAEWARYQFKVLQDENQTAPEHAQASLKALQYHIQNMAIVHKENGFAPGSDMFNAQENTFFLPPSQSRCAREGKEGAELLHIETDNQSMSYCASAPTLYSPFSNVCSATSNPAYSPGSGGRGFDSFDFTTPTSVYSAPAFFPDDDDRWQQDQVLQESLQEQKENLDEISHAMFDLITNNNDSEDVTQLIGQTLSECKETQLIDILTSCNKQGDTLLLAACRSRKLPVVELILRRGKSVRKQLDLTPQLLGAKNAVGLTALHVACHSDFFSYEIADALLSCGGAATCYATDRAGCTPLHYAAATGSSDLIALLLTYGASAMHRDKRGSLPVEYVDPDNLKCFNLLYQIVSDEPDRKAEFQANDDLWEKRLDGATGQIYFYNTKTGEVSFLSSADPESHHDRESKTQTATKSDKDLLALFTSHAWRAGLEGMLAKRREEAKRFATAQAKAKLLLIEKGEEKQKSLQRVVDMKNKTVQQLRKELSKVADGNHLKQDQLQQALEQLAKERDLLSAMSRTPVWTNAQALQACIDLETEQNQRQNLINEISAVRTQLVAGYNEQQGSSNSDDSSDALNKRKAFLEQQLERCFARITSLTKEMSDALESNEVEQQTKDRITCLLEREEKLRIADMEKAAELERENWRIQLLNEQLALEKQAIEQKLSMERKEFEEESQLRQAHEQKLRQAENDLAELQASLERERIEREQAKQDLLRIQDEMKKLSKERIEDAKFLAKQEIAARERFEKSAAEFSSVENELSAAQQAKEDAAQELDQLKAKLREEQQHKEKAKRALAGLTKRLESANAELSMLMKHLENEQTQRQRAANELSSVQAEMDRLQATHQHNKNLSDEQIRRAAEKARVLAQREQKLQADLQNSESDIARLNRELMMANYKSSQAAEEMQALQSQCDQERELRLKAMKDLGVANARVKALEDEKRLEAVKWNMERSQNERQRKALEEEYKAIKARLFKEEKERQTRQADLEFLRQAVQEKEDKLRKERERIAALDKAKAQANSEAQQEVERLRAQLEEERKQREEKDAEILRLRKQDMERIAKEKEDLAKLLRKEQNKYKETFDQLLETNKKLDEERKARRAQLDEEMLRLQSRLEQEAKEKDRQCQELEMIKHAMSELERQKEAQAGQTAEEAARAAELAEKEANLQSQLREMELHMARLANEKEKLYDEFVEEQALRKQYFNEIEDLKGRIRVFCRVRPLSVSEKEKGCSSIVQVLDHHHVVLKHPEEQGKRRKADVSFAFDACFGPQTPQSEVFADSKRVIQVALDGYNVCVFAYGQTGSGKTYTLMGPDNQENQTSSALGEEIQQRDEIEEHAGIATRSIHELFRLMHRDSARFDFELSMYVIELYKEEMVDLLFEGQGAPPPLTVHLDAQGVVYVENIREMPITDVSSTLQVLRRAFAKRKITATKMNSHSSRSHLVCSIKIKAIAKASGVATNGKLTLVDLAGSERASKTGATGDTLKEAQSINKSLLALGDVIQALTTEAKHVPYRNHPLTQLMADSIGGNAKTLMFVNISPADYNLTESKESLRWATRVKQVTNKIATKNTEAQQVKQLRSQLEKLKQAQQQQQMQQVTSPTPILPLQRTQSRLQLDNQ